MVYESMTLLSIIIPTYNRSHRLASTIDLLLRQTKLLRNEGLVEIIVGDNNSQDNTQDVLGRYVSKIAFSCFSNSDNIGITRNIIKGLNSSSGKYVWFFGDDDIIPDGLVDKIISFIESKYPTFILLPYVDFFMQPSLDDVNQQSTDFCKIDTNYNISQKFISEHDHALGFITSNIYQKIYIESCIEKFGGQYFDNNYYVKLISYYCLLCSSHCFVAHRPLVLKRCSEKSHFHQNCDIATKTFINDQIEVAYLLDSISKDNRLYNDLLKLYLVDRIRFWATLRASGCSFLGNLQIIRKKYSINIKWLIVPMVVGGLPVFLARLLKFLYPKILKMGASNS